MCISYNSYSRMKFGLYRCISVARIGSFTLFRSSCAFTNGKTLHWGTANAQHSLGQRAQRSFSSQSHCPGFAFFFFFFFIFHFFFFFLWFFFLFVFFSFVSNGFLDVFGGTFF